MARSSGKFGMGFTGASASCSSPPPFSLRSSSMRAIRSTVKSRQNGGGLGNVDDSDCGSSWSAMAWTAAAGWLYHWANSRTETKNRTRVGEQTVKNRKRARFFV